MRRTAAILALCLLSSLLVAGTLGPAPSEGASAACSEADYASLPSGQADGTLCEAQDTGRVFRWSTEAARWLPPDVVPTDAFLAYAGSAIPTAATPAWTRTATDTYSEAVAGGVLTITDSDASGRCWYQRSEAEIVNTNDLGVVIRLRITSITGAAGTGYKAFVCLAAHAAADVGCWTLQFTGSLDELTNISPMNVGDGSVLSGETVTWSPDNSAWHTYLLRYWSTEDRYSFDALDVHVLEYMKATKFTSNPGFPYGSISWGTSATSSTLTMEVDGIVAFIH